MHQLLAERRDTVSAALVIGVLHVLGWGGIVAILVTSAGSAVAPMMLGLGVTAYLLGMRHAFDADHIAAIDNTTRTLLAQRRPASTVGLWFSLGHSTVVVLLCVGLSLGISALGTQLSDAGSPLHAFSSVFGPMVAGVFLIVIGLVNAAVALAALRADGAATAGGPVSRMLSRAGRIIKRPHQMYAVGFLFGLGFDTATEVALLAIVATSSNSTVPWVALLVLPALFAAGMSLLDTLQGLVARRAYGWGRRPIGYDLILTGVTLAAALTIGTISLCTGLADSLQLGGPIALVASIDLHLTGFVLTGVLVIAWIVATVGARRQAAHGRVPGGA
jgi:high-affinity nickel-transport protein